MCKWTSIIKMMFNNNLSMLAVYQNIITNTTIKINSILQVRGRSNWPWRFLYSEIEKIYRLGTVVCEQTIQSLPSTFS